MVLFSINLRNIVALILTWLQIANLGEMPKEIHKNDKFVCKGSLLGAAPVAI
jgi:hypothetical protein